MSGVASKMAAGGGDERKILKAKRLISMQSMPCHPLLVSEVLRRVFGFFPKEQWVSFRRVCKAWNEEVLNIKKNHHFITSKCRYNCWRNIDTSLGLYLHLMPSLDTNADLKEDFFPRMYHGNDNHEGKTSKCFKLCGFMMSDCIQFANLCGPWLKRLHLFGCYIRDANVLRMLLFEKTPCMVEFESTFCSFHMGSGDYLLPIRYIPPSKVQKQLASIKIVKSAKVLSDNGKQSWDFPINMMRLLAFFPALKKIHVTCPQNNNALDQMLDVIGKIRSATGDQALQLQSLRVESDPFIINRFNRDTIVKLCQLKLPITSLDGFLSVGITKDDLTYLVLTHRSTLKELNLMKMLPFYYTNWSFMPKTLTKLVLNEVNDRPWSFLNKLHHLKIFVVIPGVNPVPNINFLSGCRVVLRKLQTFHFFVKDPVDFELLMAMTVIMPNLIDLYITIRSFRFELIPRAWSLLEKFAGDITHVNERIFVQNLTALKRLKVFSLSPSSPQQFGNMSIYDGFLRLPELQTLNIKLDLDVSKKAINSLKRHVGSTIFYNQCFLDLNLHAVNHLQVGESDNDEDN